MALVPASTSPRREKHTPRGAAIDNHAEIDVPLDFCYMNITDILECKSEDPRTGTDRKAQRSDDEKYCTKCLRLPYNVVQDLKSLPGTLQEMLLYPDQLSWLDLSHNELTIIDEVLCDLTNLKILNLHGNQIANIAEVDKLGGLPYLMKLTLHGNPIENTKNYRFYALSRIPHLREFDYSAITKGDRATCSTITFTPQRKKKKQSDD